MSSAGHHVRYEKQRCLGPVILREWSLLRSPEATLLTDSGERRKNLRLLPPTIRAMGRLIRTELVLERPLKRVVPSWWHA